MGRKFYRVRYPRNRDLNRHRFRPNPNPRFDLAEEGLRAYCRNTGAEWDWPTMQRLLNWGKPREAGLPRGPRPPRAILRVVEKGIPRRTRRSRKKLPKS
jgi:hypothetical protein